MLLPLQQNNLLESGGPSDEARVTRARVRYPVSDHASVSSCRSATRQASLAAVTVAAVSGLLGGASTSAVASVEHSAPVAVTASATVGASAQADLSSISSHVGSAVTDVLTEIGILGTGAARGKAGISAVASADHSATASAVGAGQTGATANVDYRSAVVEAVGRAQTSANTAEPVAGRLTRARFRFPKAEYAVGASIRTRAIATVAPDGLNKFSDGDISGLAAPSSLASVDISSVSAIRAGARTSALVSDDIAAVASVSGRADLTGQAALDAGATAGVTGWAQLSSRAQVLGLFDGYAQTVAEAGTSVAPTADYIATSAIRAGAQTSAVAELLTDATASIKSEAAVSGRSDIEEDRVISAVGRAQTSAYVTGDWAIPASISGRASTSAVATLDTPAITSVRCGAVASIISDRTVRVGTKSIGQARTSAVTQSLGPFDAVGQITGRASISSAIGTTGLSIEGVVQLVGRAVAVANPYILVSGTGTVPTEALTGVDTGPSFPTEARGPYGAFAIRIDAKSTSARFCDEDTVASAFENIRSVKAEFEG